MSPVIHVSLLIYFSDACCYEPFTWLTAEHLHVPSRPLPLCRMLPFVLPALRCATSYYLVLPRVLSCFVSRYCVYLVCCTVSRYRGLSGVVSCCVCIYRAGFYTLTI